MPKKKNIEKTKSAAKQMPLFVKAVSILYYAGAAVNLGILVFLVLMAAGFSAANPLIGAAGAALSLVFAMIILGVAVIEFFTARGLWKGRKWARITAIILSVVGILISLSYLKSAVLVGILLLAVNAAIILYLLINKEAKQAFK